MLLLDDRSVIYMISASLVAKYYLSKDPKRILFNNNVVIKNGRKSYEGNVRLNKYLFLSQVVYLAKYEKKLFEDNFVAYDNGPVIKEIINEYPLISSRNENVEISDEIKEFLDKIYASLINASYDELIEITHEDPEWIRLSKDTYNAPIMNLEKNIDEYKQRYKGLISALKI